MEKSRTEGEQPQLGDLLTIVNSYLLTRITLQVPTVREIFLRDLSMLFDNPSRTSSRIPFSHIENKVADALEASSDT